MHGSVGPRMRRAGRATLLAYAGATGVGTNTVPETAAVRDEGIGVLGLSLVTNMAVRVG